MRSCRRAHGSSPWEGCFLILRDGEGLFFALGGGWTFGEVARRFSLWSWDHLGGSEVRGEWNF